MFRLGSILCRTAVLFAAGAVLLGSIAAHAAPEKRAALSVLGDRMSLVTARMQTGTNTNPNMVNPVPMPDSVLDNLALRALVDAKVSGTPEVVTLTLRDPRYTKQERLFAGGTNPLLDALRKALAPSNVTHVLLVAKMRADARFPIADG